MSTWVEDNYLKRELYELIKSDESIFDFIFESSLDGLWYWDLENPENEWMNPKFWMVLGYNPDEMPHKSSSWQNIINQDDLKTAISNFTKHCENPNHPYDQIVRYTHKNGSTVWIRCRGMAIRDKNGKPVRMLGAHHDITEIKSIGQNHLKLMESVKESEEKYLAFYNNSPLSYQSLDENGCFLDINPMWEKTLGYQRNEVIGKWYGDYLHPDYVEHFRINFPAFKERGYVSDVQFKLRKKDGTYIHVSFEGCIGYTPEGKFKQTYCVFKDITQQKTLENDLTTAKEKAEESEEKYKLLHENAGVGIGYYSPDGVVISFNKTAAKHMNGVPEDFAGKSIYDLFPKESADIYYNRIRKAVISSEPNVYEDCVNLPIENKWFLSTFTRIKNSNNEILGIQIISQDITEQKNTELELKEAKEKIQNSEIHLKTLINALPDLIWLKDADGVYLNCNHRFEDFFGAKEEEIVGKTDYDFLEPEVADFFRNHDKNAMNAGKPTSNEEEITFANDGHKEFLETIKTPLLDNHNNLIGVLGVGRNITNRKLIEMALKENEERLRLAHKATNDVVWDWDIVNDSQRWNEAGKVVFGWTDIVDGPMRADWWVEKLHPDDRQRVHDSFFGVVNNPSSYVWNDEYRFLKADGDYADVLDRGYVLRNEHGKAIRMVGAMQNITERKLSEKLINQEKLFNEMLIESLPGIFYMFDSNFVPLKWNRNKAELLGLTNEEMKTHNTLDYIAPKDKEKVIETFKQTFIEGSSQVIVNIINHEGKEYSYHLTGKRLDTTNGSFLLGVGIDVTERIKAESELVKAKEEAEKSEEKFRKAILANPDSITINRIKDGVYVSANNGFYKTFEYTENEIIGKSSLFINIWHDIEQRAIYKTILQDNGILENFEAKFVTKTGKILDCLVSSSVFLFDGEIFTINVTKDISYLKKIENDLIAAKQKAEESDKLKSAFLQNMSHEIRTPLNGIIGFSSMLAQEDLTPQEIDEYTSLIKNSGDRLIETVGNILDISKIETGLADIKYSKFELNTFMEDLFTFYLRDTTSRNIELTYHCDNFFEGCFIETDYNKLNQIFSNLLGNAIKFTTQGKIEYGYYIKEQNIQFFVSDTGIGIPEEFHHRIFSRFAQADLSISRGYEGVGLGLSICKGLVDLLGGNIWFESQTDKGTTFSFTLPSNNMPKFEIEQKSAVEVKKENKDTIILVAEDDWASYKYLDRILTKLNIKYYYANNGRKAIDYVKENEDINLILMDIKMPDINGLEALKVIKELRPEIPVIAQTAYASTSQKDYFIEIGFDDYISKPIDKDELIKMLVNY